MGKIVSAGYRGCGWEREGVEWVVRVGVGAVGRNDPTLYAHMNNKTIKKTQHILNVKNIKKRNQKKKATCFSETL
jgi:hypothetical protein